MCDPTLVGGHAQAAPQLTKLPSVLAPSVKFISTVVTQMVPDA